jgi:hypothetical protein
VMRRSYPTPPRSFLSDVERDNPDGVQQARFCLLVGRPRGRPMPPAGAGRLEKRTPAAERQQETGTECRHLRWRSADNWPDRGRCLDLKGC